MRYGPLAQRLIGLALTVASASGCMSLQGQRPVPVLVRDAETGQPIAGAEVQIVHPLLRGSPAITGHTAADGMVRLHARPSDDSGILEASATGYLLGWQDLPVEELRKLEPAHLLEKVEQRPARYVVDLYALPRPTVEFVVPAGFKGRFKAVWQIRHDAPTTPGQRCFNCAVPWEGDVVIVGPPVLGKVTTPEFRAKYEDGRPLNQDVKGQEIGFWYLKYESGEDYFLIGTAGEYAAIRSLEQRQGPQDGRRGGGGRSGGAGGMGRRGGRGGGGGNSGTSAPSSQ
jgi:uncharacterized membrane protein YgcG